MTANVAVGTTTCFGKERNMPATVDPAVKATVKHFTDAIRSMRISPSMREIEVSLAVERLMEEHGIEVEPATINRMVDRK